jgi:toxin ParE1/3/4
MPGIIRRPRVERDLIDLWHYIAAVRGDVRADAMIDRIEQKLEALAVYPLMGRARDELRPALRSSPVGRYIVFYFPLDDGIDVVRVLYGGRDLDAIFQEEEREEDDRQP